MDTAQSVVCFYHEYEENGCFSNWYRAGFDYAGHCFSSAEQFMMYHKVMMFRQYDLGEQILETDSPGEIKKLGRTAFPEFSDRVWSRTCRQIVKRGVRAKFEQNPELRQKLLDTGEKVLAECSAGDRKWGIGLSDTDPGRFEPQRWKGENLLGSVLMEVREELRHASLRGTIEAQNTREADSELWHCLPGVLRKNPKYQAVIDAYADTLRTAHEKRRFLYGYTFAEWDLAMNVNMGGGLTAVGFWEMKQDLFDTCRYG